MNTLRPIANAVIAEESRTALLSMTAADAPPATSWIQLARTGTWRGYGNGFAEFTFDADLYEEIVRNFCATKNRELPLDFEHGAESTDGGVFQRGAPAQGWIRELRFNADMLEGRVDWVMAQPGVGYVRDGAYKYISPAVIFDSIDRVTGKPIGAELTSAALTNRPFLDGMKPVTASRRAANGVAMTKDEARSASLRATDRRDVVALSAGDGMAFDQLRSALCDQLCDKFGWCYVEDVFATYAVFSREGRMWRADYAADGSTVKITSDAAEVVRSYDSVEGGMQMKALMSRLGLNENASETAAIEAIGAIESKVATLSAS